MRRIFLYIFLCLVIGVVGCGDNNVIGSEKKQIVLAMVYNAEGEIRDNQAIEEEIELFNKTHENCEIVIKKYVRSENALEDGVHLLQREIISGEGPDLIDFGSGYTKADIVGKYTENLYEYIDTDYSLRTDLYLNVLDSFSIDTKLYAIPLAFQLNSFVGRREDIGNIEGWNVSEMLCMLEKSRKKYPMGYDTKAGVFGNLMYASLEDFVDWENGKSYFDSSDFRNVLEYANKFDYEYNQNMGEFSFNECTVRQIIIGNVFATAIAEGELGTQDVTYAGFPNKAKSGTVVSPCRNVIAISMASKNKDCAWEFIRQLLGTRYQERINDCATLSVNREVVEKQLDLAMHEEIENGEKKVKASYAMDYSYDFQPIYHITEKQKNDFKKLVEEAKTSSTDDEKIYEIIFEEADGYFAGQKTVDDVIEGIENRVWIYISEKGK